LMILSREKPDLILLDLMLPGIKGEEVLERTNGIPVIVVSAKNDSRDKVSLLRSGASDYVTKPFDSEELLARIELRIRENKTHSSSISSKGYEIREGEREVYYGGESVRLTRTEWAILKCLMLKDGDTVSKSSLLERIAFDTPDCTESSLKMHVSNLRHKLSYISGKDSVESVWGVGFRLV
ncbi:MAG: response regulator transcription factor, partial [Candidatus Ornithospirochaeta sp.]